MNVMPENPLFPPSFAPRGSNGMASFMLARSLPPSLLAFVKQRRRLPMTIVKQRAVRQQSRQRRADDLSRSLLQFEIVLTSVARKNLQSAHNFALSRVTVVQM